MSNETGDSELGPGTRVWNLDQVRSRWEILRRSWARFGEVAPAMHRSWCAALLWGGITAATVLSLLIGRRIGHAAPYAPILVEAAFLLGAGGFMFLGFSRHRLAYRERYGTLAYQHLFFRFIAPFVLLGEAAIIFPVFVSGPPLLPHAVAYTVAAYLFITAALLEARGPEIFWDIEWRAFVYNVFPERGRLVTSGVFHWLRHPIYSAVIRFALALGLMRNNLPALLCAVLAGIGVWVLGTVEEREIMHRDPEYAAYRAAIPAFIARHPVRFWRYLVTAHTSDGG